ncbi:MAG: GGDEF domain-containing protein [Oscillospiraceae bacterium]|jgi:diguanylate cyclase (GGDEF)-like protein|nr:GGDEF domain-containing protein [Oscillospiraceae bacterium]
MSGSKTDFWIQIMKKLDTNSDLNLSIPNILDDLCRFLGFGCGFIYQANHEAKFFLYEHFALYDNNHLTEVIDLNAVLGPELANQLTKQRSVSFRADTKCSPLEIRLGDIFNANSMVLIPILDQTRTLIAIVGIVDRRGHTRVPNDDMAFTYYVLTILANHVKTRLYQKRVEATQRSLESVLDNMGVDIYVNDFYTHEILYVNRSMAAPYGGVENMMGKICWQTLYDDKTGQCDYCPQLKLIDADGNPTNIYSWDYQRPFDGSWFRVLSAAFQWVDGRLAHIVSSIDITENKQNEDIIRRMAEYDNLTGLPNRHKLVQDCEKSILHLAETGSEGFILFFDLDKFKNINDSLGHRAGDELLITIGAHLQQNPLTHNRCYRYGGDEFVILCDRSTPGKVSDIVRFLLQSFRTPWKLPDGTEVFCQTSIGISHFPYDSDHISDLLRKADHAMYTSKNNGTGLAHFFDSGAMSTPEDYYKKYPALI